jgi:glycerol uptake facilitator-like aquaporin
MTTIKKQDIRDFVVEALGVFSLCYFGGLSCISLPYTLPIFGTDKDIGIPVTLPIAVAHGIILGMLIIIGGGIKGPQYNPAVTIVEFKKGKLSRAAMIRGIIWIFIRIFLIVQILGILPSIESIYREFCCRFLDIFNSNLVLRQSLNFKFR